MTSLSEVDFLLFLIILIMIRCSRTWGKVAKNIKYNILYIWHSTLYDNFPTLISSQNVFPSYFNSYQWLLLIESFYYWTTFNFETPAALVFQLEVCCKVDRLLTGLTAQQIVTTARWYSNKTPLYSLFYHGIYSYQSLCKNPKWTFIFM